MTANFKYKAYTLIEMLIVLAIFVIIATIGFSSFYGLKDAISMNEKVLSLSQEFRYAQRSALFLERRVDDKWLYGIGIDFSTAQSEGTYRLFQWCSQFSDYGSARTKADFPNFDKTFPVGTLNGNLPVGNYAQSCNGATTTTELALLPNSGDRTLGGFEIRIPTNNDGVGDVGSWPAYVLFESVSGRVFFYDSVGNIVNFNSAGAVISSPIDFRISLESDNTKTRKTINLSNISGKVDVEVEKI